MNQLFKKTFSVFRQSIAAMLALTIMLTALTAGLSAMINRIKIIDSSLLKIVYTLSSSPSSILANAGIKLDSGDSYSMNWLNGREGELILQRALEVTVSYNDQTVTVNMPRTTVDKAIKKAGFTLTDDMVLNCSVNANLDDGMKIEIYDVITETVYEEVAIPFETVKKKSSKVIKGTEKVSSEGKGGVKKLTYSRTVVNGEVISNELVGEEVVKKPVDRVILVGTKTTSISATPSKPSASKPSTSKPSTSEPSKDTVTSTPESKPETGTTPDNSQTEATNPETDKTVYYTKAGYKYVSSLKPSTDFKLTEKGVPVNYKKKLTGKASAYSYGAGSKTATGKKVRTGYIAIDPKQIPYGTKMYIRSTDGKYVYGYCSAEDTGGFVKWGTRIADLFFPSESACVKFGVRSVEIYIL